MVETNAGEVEALISKIEGYIIGRRNEPKVLQDPLVPILPAGQERPTYSDVSPSIRKEDISTDFIKNLDNLLAALRAFQASNWEPSAVLPAYLREIVPIPGPTAPVPYELQEVAMPPELYEVDSDELDVGEGQIGNFTFFADEVSQAMGSSPIVANEFSRSFLHQAPSTDGIYAALFLTSSIFTRSIAKNVLVFFWNSASSFLETRSDQSFLSPRMLPLPLLLGLLNRSSSLLFWALCSLFQNLIINLSITGLSLPSCVKPVLTL